MPQASIRNPIANVRIRNEYPNVRASAFQTGERVAEFSTDISAGTPIGLLLALTYANLVTVVTPHVYFSDFRPNVSIKNLI